MTTTREAWDVLQMAESEYSIVTVSREQAGCAGYQELERPEELLWWILDEAERLEGIGDKDTREHSKDIQFISEQYQDSTILRRYAIELFLLGIQPMKPVKKGE